MEMPPYPIKRSMGPLVLSSIKTESRVVALIKKIIKKNSNSPL